MASTAHVRGEALRAAFPRTVHSLGWPVAALAATIALQFTQVFRRALNWDEFWHYSQIHQLADGTLSRPLQTLHTRLFGWVIALPGTGVDHVIIIRLFMFGCEMFTSVAIAAMAARFSNKTAGLLCALAYLTFPFVFRHGYSFRFDPPAAALMMGTLWLFMRSRLDARSIALTGLMLGIAAMVTIKIVLYAPAFLGILWLRWQELGRSTAYLARVAIIAPVALGVFTAIFLIHSREMAGDAGANAWGIVSISGQTMFKIENQPYWPVAMTAALLSPAVTVMVALFLREASRHIRGNAETTALIGLFLPLTTLLFYHNTAPYYYVFMLPPVLVACSVSVGWLTSRFTVAGTTGIMMLTLAIAFANDGPRALDKQRTILRSAEKIFKSKVNYFDFCGILGSFPKANPFMTTVRISTYLAGDGPSLRKTMEAKAVPLVIENHEMFSRVLRTHSPSPSLRPEDSAALSSNYVEFWGPFWLAGKDIPAGETSYRFTILVPGPYTLEQGRLTLDGQPLPAGSVVILKRGEHVAGGKRSTPARLIWGSRLRRPSEAPPAPPYFDTF